MKSICLQILTSYLLFLQLTLKQNHSEINATEAVPASFAFISSCPTRTSKMLRL